MFGFKKLKVKVNCSINKHETLQVYIYVKSVDIKENFMKNYSSNKNKLIINIRMTLIIF